MDQKLSRRDFIGRSLKTAGGIALAPSLASLLAACGTAAPEGSPENPAAPVGSFEYLAPDGTRTLLPEEGLMLATPARLAGLFELYGSDGSSVEPVVGSVEQTRAEDDSKIYRVSFVGRPAATYLAEADSAIPIITQAPTERVEAQGGDYYDPVTVGTNPNVEGARHSSSELEDLVIGTVGSSDWLGENRFYMVLERNGDDYNTLVTQGAIAGLDAVRRGLSELKDYASTDVIGDTSVRVLPGNYGTGPSNGMVVRVEDPTRTVAFQALVGDGELDAIARRASLIGSLYAPGAASETYLSR